LHTSSAQPVFEIHRRPPPLVSHKSTKVSHANSRSYSHNPPRHSTITHHPVSRDRDTGHNGKENHHRPTRSSFDAHAAEIREASRARHASEEYYLRPPGVYNLPSELRPPKRDKKSSSKRQELSEAALYATRYRERERERSGIAQVETRQEVHGNKGLATLTQKIGRALSFGKGSSTPLADREKAMPPLPTEHSRRPQGHYDTTSTRLRTTSSTNHHILKSHSQSSLPAPPPARPIRKKVVSFSEHPTTSSKARHAHTHTSSHSHSGRERKESGKLNMIPVVFPALYGNGRPEYF
jgi:hypothetical protein